MVFGFRLPHMRGKNIIETFLRSVSSDGIFQRNQVDYIDYLRKDDWVKKDVVHYIIVFYLLKSDFEISFKFYAIPLEILSLK